MSDPKEIRIPAPQAPAPVENAAGLARHLERMARMVRGEAAPSSPDEGARQSGGGQPELGWWVLAQGEVLDDGDFQAREAARERLLAQVRRAGLMVEQHVWVWDETWRAQLVVATLPSHARAWRVAERLREKGLTLRVRREMPEGDAPGTAAATPGSDGEKP